MERDPVCGMNVDPQKTQWVAKHEGKKILLLQGRMHENIQQVSGTVYLTETLKICNQIQNVTPASFR